MFAPLYMLSGLGVVRISILDKEKLIITRLRAHNINYIFYFKSSIIQILYK